MTVRATYPRHKPPVVRLSPPVVLALATLALAGAARSGTLSVRVSSVNTQSNSAAIWWHSTTPGHAVVEYGTTGEYGLWTAPTTQARDGRIVLPGLEPRTEYHFAVTALGIDGTRAVTTGAFKTRPIGTATRATTSPNALVVNDQPLFPR